MDLDLLDRLTEEAVRIRGSKGSFDLVKHCFPSQLSFIQDPKHFKVAVCSRRAGKTTACAAHLIHEATTKPNRVCLYVTLSRLNAKRIIWNELLTLNSRHHLGGTPNETELSIRFPSGSTIYLSGAKDKSEIEKFRGLAISLCYIDECQSFRAYIKELIDDVIGPALMDYSGTLCLIGTPAPVQAGYYYECSTNPDWGTHAWTFWDNPFIAIKSGESHQTILDRELKRRGVKISDPSIQREWFGKWVIDLDSLVFKFSPLNHYDALPNFNKWETIIGVDLGFDDSDAISVLGWNEHDKRCYVLEEEVKAKQGITELAHSIGSLVKKYSPLKVVMDTGGLGKKIAEEIRKRHDIPIHAAEKARKFEYIELVNDALRTGRLFAKKDSHFAQDCMLVEWDFDSQTPDKLKISDRYHSDICDSVLYAYREALHWLSEPEKPKVSLKDHSAYLKHTHSLMEERLAQQIAKEEADERAQDLWSISQMDNEGDVLRHYLNKRHQ